jgi:carboxypeptidase Q
LKSALAGAAGAVGVLIYNNVEGPLEGDLAQPTRPEGPYTPTVGLSQADGLTILSSLTSEVIADLTITYVEVTTCVASSPLEKDNLSLIISNRF